MSKFPPKKAMSTSLHSLAELILKAPKTSAHKSFTSAPAHIAWEPINDRCHVLEHSPNTDPADSEVKRLKNRFGDAVKFLKTSKSARSGLLDRYRNDFLDFRHQQIR